MTSVKRWLMRSYGWERGELVEFLIGYVMIAVIMLCMGFTPVHIGVMTLIIIGVVIVLIGAFFVVCLVFLAMSKRKTAVFASINEEPRFPVAVYKIDGEDVPNMFPCEMIMREKLYIPDKEIKILYCKPRRRAIDKNALVTMIAGSAVFIPAAAFSLIMLIAFIK